MIAPSPKLAPLCREKSADGRTRLVLYLACHARHMTPRKKSEHGIIEDQAEKGREGVVVSREREVGKGARVCENQTTSAPADGGARGQARGLTACLLCMLVAGFGGLKKKESGVAF